MIRIKPRRCGYGGEKGYTCQRLPQLQDWMFNEEIPFIAQMQAEFNKLPLRVKGMVYTEETIDMGWSEFGPHPEVPELTCRSNTDPASDTTDVSVWGSTGIPVEVGNATAYPVYGGSSGWLDLFNSGYEITGGTQYFYHNVSGTAAATSDVYIKVTGVDHEYHDIYLVGNIPTFKNGEQEMEMGPGLLEPMLDTDFAPVGIDTIPAWEAGLDADIFTNIVLNAWKGVIDDRIQNIYARLNNIPTGTTDYNLRDLKREEYENTDCQNFRINLSSGDSLQTRGNQIANLYTVTDGQVAVDDYSVYVSGDIFTVEPAMDYPIYVWVRVYETEGSGTTTTAEIVLLDDSYSIGDELSGGEVIAKEQISVPGSVYRYKYTVQFDDGRKYTGLLFFGFPLPDADDHVVVVGGVRKVFGGTDDDSFVLLKIFQTECSPVMNFASDAETGLHGVIDFDINGNEIITPLPGSTVTPEPGIVQPAVNIALVVNGSTETNTQSTTDVPTVEAVYNFIHGITAYNGPVANAKATEVELSGISGSTVFGEPVDYVIPINKDRWAQNTEDEIAGYTTSESMYEAAKAAWELAGEPTEGEIYEAYIEASTIYSDAYYTVYGDVSDGEPGTTYVINNIVLMNGDMMGVAATTAPSVRAVYNFVHDIYALSTAGTILVNAQNVPYVSHGTPGTVFTVDSLDKARYEAEEYYQDEVPTVKAVMDYVEGRPCQSSVAGLIAVSAGTESLASVHGTTAAAGIVQPVKNINIGTQDPNAVSPTAVPTVEAVYNFIHGNTITGYDVADAKADIVGSTITAAGSTAAALVAGAKPGTFHVTNDFTILGGTVTDYTGPQAVPTALAVYIYVTGYVSAYLSAYTAKAGYIKVNSTTGKESLYSAANLTYQAGCVYTVMNINMTSPGTKREISEHTVPTVEAIINYIHQNKTYHYIADGAHYTATLDIEDSKATPTAMTISSPGTASESVSHTGTPGTVQVTTDIICVTGTTITATGCVVPTAQAVVDYVLTHGPAVIGATVGILVVNTSGETISDITGSTHAAGVVQTVENIKMHGTANKRSESLVSVPTVEAVINYIRGTTIGGLSDTESSLAVAGSITQTPATGEPTSVSFSGGQQGVVNVTSNIIAVNGETSCTDCVPTADAVAKYVALHGGTGSMLFPNIRALGYVSESLPSSAAHGQGVTFLIAVEAGSTIGVEYGGSGISVYAAFADSEAEAGTVFTSGFSVTTDGYARVSVIDTGYSDGCVRFLKDGHYMSLYKSANLKATAGSVISVSGGAESVDGSPGRVYISNGVYFGGDKAYSQVTAPSMEAVYDFIHGTTAAGVAMMSSLADIAGSTITGTTALALVSGTKPGTVYVTNDFTLFGGTVTTYNDPQAVPTAKAVADYVRLYGGDVSEAVIGSFTATDSSESWVSGSTAAPGIFDVVDTLAAATTVSTRSISTASVPTVAAVKDYVDGYIGTYTGPFCVNSDGTINGGDVYFAGASICTAAKRTTQMSGTQTIWLVITKTGSTTYSASWSTGATNTATTVSYPIAKCTGTGTSRVFTQLHYGALNITGRWM